MKKIDPFSGAALMELYWFFVQEHRDMYEVWKEDFLADPPPDYSGARKACAVESTAPPAGSD